MSEEEYYSTMLELLTGIDFDTRYFGYYDAHANLDSSQAQSLTLDDLRQCLSVSGVEFEFIKNEKVCIHREVHAHCTMDFGVALLYGSSVELVLSLKTAVVYIGGPFPMLARHVAESRDPTFAHSPQSPKLPVSNVSELRDAVFFGIGLFKDSTTALVSFADWDGPRQAGWQAPGLSGVHQLKLVANRESAEAD